MEIFYSGENMDRLYPLITNDFTFQGPLFEFESAKSYIESLIGDPPIECNYSLIESYETKSSACLVYQFSKPGISVPMAQYFEVDNEKISRILLVFDTRAFAE